MPDPAGPASSIAAPSVNVRGARVAFGGVVLFDGLDIDLPGGRWTCLLGPSGVGKSTLLRVVLVLEAANGNGHAPVVTCSDQRPLAGRAAFMAQRDMLFPWLSVIANVTLGIRLRGGKAEAPAAVERARALLADVGLAGQERAMPDTLSGGMRQRVALARTLMEDRPVLMMDEPFSALDVITRVRLQTLAARLLKGRTVLLVTHDPLEAIRLGHRIHVMAGAPARLDEALVPEGPTPRDVDDPAVLRLQGDLLRRLAEATQGVAVGEVMS